METTIHSVRNPRVKLAIRLRDRRGRRQQHRIIVDGLRETTRAIQAGVRPIELFVCPPLLVESDQTELENSLNSAGVHATTVSREVFDKLAFGDRSDGVVMVAAEPRAQLTDIFLPTDGLVLVLESLEKPGNLGAIVRTADAAGAACVIVADAATDLFNPNAIRASAGAIFRVPLAAAAAQDVRDWLQAHQVITYAAHVDAAIPYTAITFRGRSAVILGSESRGLSEEWRAPSVVSVAIPMLGIADSLNVSVAAAVFCYEALRQRQAGIVPPHGIR